MASALIPRRLYEPTDLPTEFSLSRVARRGAEWQRFFLRKRIEMDSEGGIVRFSEPTGMEADYNAGFILYVFACAHDSVGLAPMVKNITRKNEKKRTKTLGQGPQKKSF